MSVEYQTCIINPTELSSPRSDLLLPNTANIFLLCGSGGGSVWSGVFLEAVVEHLNSYLAGLASWTIWQALPLPAVPAVGAQERFSAFDVQRCMHFDDAYALAHQLCPPLFISLFFFFLNKIRIALVSVILALYIFNMYLFSHPSIYNNLFHLSSVSGRFTGASTSCHRAKAGWHPRHVAGSHGDKQPFTVTQTYSQFGVSNSTHTLDFKLCVEPREGPHRHWEKISFQQKGPRPGVEHNLLA